ncbi:baseplate tail-tube junction protein [Candidatus Pelagibacter sp.]|nr:baseplate tail-tube junction protein [Candidatus Pelagibacter sp.]
MSIVNTLKNLRSNLFGGPGNTGFSKPPPSKVQNIGMTSTPTSSLDSDPLSFGTYQFPKDVFENQQLGHYMVFYVNVQDRSKYYYGSDVGYNGADAGFVNSTNKYGDVGIKSIANRLKVKSNKTTGTNFGTGDPNLSKSSRNSNSLQGLSSVNKTTMRIKDSIALYLPANVSDTTSATYEDTPTGMLGVAATDAIRLGQSFSNKDFEAAGQIAGKAMSEFAQEAFKRLGAELVEGLTGSEGAIPLANKIFGRADNPFVEVFFNSMNVRTFTYNFNFAPRNEDETMEIQQIIQLFRFHMAPELQGTNSRYLTLPSEFDIHYMYKAKDGNGYENDYYNRIGTCVLENVSTNYTPGDKVRSFADGAPTQITMSLTFRETEVLTKEKINAGY